MKHLLLAVLLICVSCSVPPKFRDTLPSDDSSVEFIENHNKSSDASFDKIAEWVAVNFNSAKDVIQLSSKESGTMVLKPIWKFAYPVDPLKTSFYEGYVNYTLTIKTKENKCKIAFETGTVKSPGCWWDGKYPSVEMSAELKTYYTNLKDSLLKALNAESKSSDF